jgi:hypothetical protein
MALDEDGCKDVLGAYPCGLEALNQSQIPHLFKESARAKQILKFLSRLGTILNVKGVGVEDQIFPGSQCKVILGHMGISRLM